MRVHLEKDVGYLTCKDGKSKEDIITIPFYRDNILDWYPLYVNYEYKYDQVTREFFLAPSEYSHPNKYGITKRRRNSSAGGVSFTSDRLYVPEVRAENINILEEADKRGFPTIWDTDTTLEDISRLHIELTDEIDKPIKENITQRAYENMNEEDWLKYFRAEEEVKDTMLYKYATDEELEKLYLSGSLRVLLNLLRKGVYANGI